MVLKNLTPDEELGLGGNFPQFFLFKALGSRVWEYFIETEIGMVKVNLYPKL
jgi:hypothetical protein